MSDPWANYAKNKRKTAIRDLLAYVRHPPKLDLWDDDEPKSISTAPSAPVASVPVASAAVPVPVASAPFKVAPPIPPYTPPKTKAPPSAPSSAPPAAPPLSAPHKAPSSAPPKASRGDLLSEIAAKGDKGGDFTDRKILMKQAVWEDDPYMPEALKMLVAKAQAKGITALSKMPGVDAWIQKHPKAMEEARVKQAVANKASSFKDHAARAIAQQRSVNKPESSDDEEDKFEDFN